MFYRPALHGNWNALSLTRRALKEKFPTPMVPLTTVLPNRQVFLPDPIEFIVEKVHLVVVPPPPTQYLFCPCQYHSTNVPYSSIHLPPTLSNINNWQHHQI
jgi:hypothetical protein